MNSEKNILPKGDYLGFTVCGKFYRLSQYDDALIENEEILHKWMPFLKEFPYSVRQVKGEDINSINDLPLSIIYKKEELSLFDYLTNNRMFENNLKRLTGVSGLERVNELELITSDNTSRAIITETMRVLQDLSFCFNTARFALIKAQRIIQFRSETLWVSGWEQLWTRATWLNNAIVMYNSCFDKLIQAIWIAFEVFVDYQKEDENGKPVGERLNLQSLNSLKGLENVYKACVFNAVNCRIRSCLPSGIMKTINKKSSEDFKTIREFANKIKHRGGMRYKDLFPYGDIIHIENDDEYSSFRTQYSYDIDDVIEEVAQYNNNFLELANKVIDLILERFDKKISDQSSCNQNMSTQMIYKPPKAMRFGSKSCLVGPTKISNVFHLMYSLMKKTRIFAKKQYGKTNHII